MAKIPMRYDKNGRKVRGYARGTPRGIYADRDYGTRARIVRQRMAGRNSVRKGYDKTIPIRDSMGRILGRTPQVKPGQRQVQARPFGRKRTLNIKQVRAR